MGNFIFDEPCDKWTKKLINKYMWAMRADTEFSDLYNECYIKFLVITDGRYEIENQRHGMSLYMVSCVNRMNDLAAKACRYAKQFAGMKALLVGRKYSDSVSAIAHLDAHYVTCETQQRQIEEFELRGVVSDPMRSLIDDSWDFTRRVRKTRKKRDGGRETTNELLCRLARVSSNEYDLRTELNELVAH